jgi:hypothetical protein
MIMAVRDIMPFKSVQGGTTQVKWGQMTASEVFDVGEPVMIVTAGTLTEAEDNDDSWKYAEMGTGAECGIAAAGPGGGSQTNDRDAHLDPMTGKTYATLAMIPYWPINEGTHFITKNFWAAAGAGSAAVPDLANIGISYMITYATFGTPDAGWGIEETAAVSGTDVSAVVLDVLDSAKTPIRLSGNAGVYLVFEIRTIPVVA